ncbi:MAG: TolC family protein [Desulfobacca sp.]|nr:TolC family protein [Desulfobacca sp.]
MSLRGKFWVIVLLGIWWGLVWNPGTAVLAQAQEAAGLPRDLQTLISQALKANPELKRRGQLRTASQEQIQAAGALDDPQLSFNLMNVPTDTWDLAQEPMTQKQILLSQKIPFPGKRRLRSEIAAEQAQANDFYYQDKANEIRAQVVQAYWGLSLAYSAFEITQKNKQLWEQVVQAAETRYSVGKGQQADILQAQVELGNYLNQLLVWRQKQESFQTQLNALRSEPPPAPIARPQELRPRPFNSSLKTLLSRASAQPQLKALQAQVTKQQKAVALARKDYFPDVTLGLGYGWRENLGPEKRADFFTSMITVNLPIWYGSKLRPREREQRARQVAAQEAYQATWDQLAAAIKERYDKLQRLDQQITLYEQGIVPQAEQAAAAALADYQVGGLDFANLYQSRIAAYNAELKLQEYLKEFEENWAALEWLVGQELPRQPGGKK